METCKVGCAIMQAMGGANIDGFSLQKFGVENWFMTPTKTMRLYRAKDQQELEDIIKLTKDINKPKNDTNL